MLALLLSPWGPLSCIRSSTNPKDETTESGSLHSDGSPDSRADSLAPMDSADSGFYVDPRVQELDPYLEPEVLVSPTQLSGGGTASVTYKGVLAGMASVTMRYGFNGWTVSDDIDSYEYEVYDSQVLYYLESTMSRQADGAWYSSVYLPTDARAMHMKFLATSEDGITSTDDNGSQYYSAEISFPLIGPFLTWNGETSPGSGIIVNWETSVPCLGVVAYGTTEDLGSYAVGQTLGNMHHVALTDLQSDQTYYYKVFDSAGRASEPRSFVTPQDSPSSLDFVVFSDMQDSGSDNRWADVAAQVASSQADVDLLLMAGDMAQVDHPGSWWIFFDRARELFPGIPLLPVPGNHDTPGISSSTDTSSFQRYFDLPFASEKEPWYALDYGSTRFLGLCSEDTDSMAPDGAQYAFVQAELDGCGKGQEKTCENVFVAWHIPPYNGGSRHSAEQGDVREITALFEGIVDWVFNGHEHLYQRMQPLRYDGVLAASGEYGQGLQDGVGYVVLPPAGYDPSSYLESSEEGETSSRDFLAYPIVEPEDDIVDSQNGYVVVQVGYKSLSLVAWGMGDNDESSDPEIVDSLSYTK